MPVLPFFPDLKTDNMKVAPAVPNVCISEYKGVISI